MAIPEQLGRYQILGLLGTGGMAEILLARVGGPIGFQRPVVIKRILPHLARQTRFQEMFLDEAKILAGIRHANVVQIHELGRESDELFLVMEYLEGESASALARRLSQHNKLLNFGLSAHLIAETAAGLHAAHELTDLEGRPQKLVHRDVSPANVFVTYGGEVKILDFGIAIAADRTSRTEAGQVKGKYAYMSPEQCLGAPLDRRSDVFSLGTVLYEMSTCRRLFKRSSDMLTLEAICHEDVIPPSQIVPEYPPELERICLRALAKEASERYRSALDMQRDLIEVARVLNGPKVPEESLGNVMRILFRDRIEEKHDLLKKSVGVATSEQARLGGHQDPGGGRAERADSESAAELFGRAALEAGTRFGSSATYQAVERSHSVHMALPRPVSHRAMWAGAFGAAVLILLGTFGLMQLESSAEADEAPSAQDAQIELQIGSEPAGARVILDGRDVGATPLTIRLERASRSVELRLSLDGYASHAERIRLDRDQRIRLALMPRTPPKPGVEP
ncbi:MAG: serine/threonine-protein kinase [Myxococcota bacterium]